MAACESEEVDEVKGNKKPVRVMPCVSSPSAPVPFECPPDDLLEMPPPPYSARRRAPPPPAPSAGAQASASSTPPPPEIRVEATPEKFVPSIGKESLRTNAILAPLREVLGPEGRPTLIHIPFTTSDLMNWKQTTGPLAEDPMKVTELLRTIFVTHSPNWGDVMTLLGALLTGEEKRRLLSLAQDEATRTLENGETPEGVIPTRDSPNWDPNSEAGRAHLTRFRKHILGALPKMYPKPLNLNKLYEVRQGKDESPSDFHERLCETARKWTNLDPAAAENQRMFNVLFIGQSQADIRTKLQKLEGGAGLPTSALIEVAFKVYHNREATREGEKEKRKMKAQASLIAAAFDYQEQSRGRGRGRGGWRPPPAGNGGPRRGGRGRGFPPTSAPPPPASAPASTGGAGERPRGNPPGPCYNCGREGHWNRDCPMVASDRCRICQGQGHWSQNCPMASNNSDHQVLYEDSD